MTPLEAARVQGRNMALSVGLRVYLYTDADGKPVFHAINPHPAAGLTLVEIFEAPPKSTPTAFAEKPGIVPE